MAIQYFNFRVPHGMALQPYADGSYNIVYDSSKIVQLRDWSAKMSNTLTEHAVAYLEQQKKEIAEEQRKRAERARQSLTESASAKIEKENERVNVTMTMMGTEDVPEPAVLNQPKTIPPKKPVQQPLIEPKLPRIVMTKERGAIEVAADVSDSHLAELGLTVVSGPTPDETNEAADTSPVEQNTSPDESSS